MTSPTLGAPTLDDIARLLDAHAPLALAGPVERRAGVALILGADAPDEHPDVLLIERAHHPRDPWSGHLAFPGGRVEPGDEADDLPDTLAAARRETREEVGLELPPDAHVVLLGEFPARPTRLSIAVHVFATRRVDRDALTLDPAEVADAFWVPFGVLLDPARHATRVYGGFGERPTVRLFDDEARPHLWGLTYHFLEVLLHGLGHPLPPTGFQDLDAILGR